MSRCRPCNHVAKTIAAQGLTRGDAMKLPDMVPLPPRPTLLFVVSLNILLHRASVAEPVVVGASEYLGGVGGSGQMPRLEYGGTANVTASVGQTARLLCRIYHLGERAVSWIRKRDLHILTTDIFTYTSDARFQVAHQEGSSNWTLLVNYAQTRDSGIYECQVNTEPKRSLAFNLHVVVELTWLLDGRPLSEERWVTESSDEYVTSRLVIRSARDSDSGTYTCAPTRAAHADVQVHVISGEHPAAMQHGVAGGQRPVCPHLILLLIGHVIVACSR
ncbi:hypothetical protein FJT64_025434 [Amphibalanus amphitrite]|uniref:Ig-like domain-containing protein n=1 Tax=Amphibalanus amphitrite TaxID=1232801 RepID=A0A6A4WBA1_AMPAM|nr:hypothetical protein FJT64_025434 [Amphibalanus amphitrite]